MSTTCHNTHIISHTSHMPTRNLHSTHKILLIARMQDMTRDTSKALLAWLMQPTPKSCRRHFSTWSVKEKNKHIQDCGLASSHFPNAVKKNEVLYHLSVTELPLKQVYQRAKELAIPGVGFLSMKRLTYNLLCFMADGLPNPTHPEPIKPVIGATPEALAEEAKKEMKKRIRSDLTGNIKVPYAYTDPELSPLWMIRRKVHTYT